MNITMKFIAALGLVTVLASVTDAGVSMHNPFFCYSTDPIREMRIRGGFLTSYEPIRLLNFTTLEPYNSTSTPSRFWYYGLDATRFPSPEFLQQLRNFAVSSVRDDIVRNYEAGRTSLCRPDFEAIRDFDIDTHFEHEFVVDNAYLIVESGIVANENIARRFQQIFPNILTEDYSPDRFYFRHTYGQMSNASIRAIASGLFGEDGSQNVIYEDVPAVDWLLLPSNFCPLFSEETADWPARQNAFVQGPEVQEMLEQVNRKLGFHTSNQMSFDQILLMSEWCKYTTTMTFEISDSEVGDDCPWCSAFSMSHHSLFEYYMDLWYFYNFGYGVRNQRLLQNMHCGLLQDLLTHMRSENSADRVARFFVTHLVAPFFGVLVALGTVRDAWPLHEHNFAQHSDRTWRSSLIVPFSANLAVVRYDSDDNDHDLIFLLHERPILIPGCDLRTGVCKLSWLESRFQRFIDANCGELFCSND